MRVFHVAKHYPPYQFWEPIFIGTKSNPLYDERLTWEGQGDKMTQGYEMCVLNYEFHILRQVIVQTVHTPLVTPNIKIHLLYNYVTRITEKLPMIFGYMEFPLKNVFLISKIGCTGNG